MFRDKISIDETIEYLDSLFVADPRAMRAMLRTLTVCNNALAEHPTAQAWTWGEDASIGLMGIINGMFGVDGDGRGAIAYCLDEAGELVGFMRTPSA